MKKVELPKEQIKKIEELQAEYGQTASELGIIEMQLYNLNIKKTELLKLYDSIKLKEEDFIHSLKIEYGEGELDIENKFFIKEDEQ